jgi:hypothetical protein
MTDAPPDSLAAAVSGPEMMANLREIARWVKLSGTAEEREAFGFLEKRMQEYGFRTTMLLHDAFISLPGKASVTVDGKALTAITQSFSLPSPAGGLSGVPVYLGHGTDADFAGKDLRGRIVLVEGMATPAVAARATAAGAAGQLHISHHEHIHEMCISPVWGSPGASTLAEMPRTVACSVNSADGGAIRDALAAGKQPQVTLHAEVDTGWRKTPILQCELDGPDADGPFVMMSGHYDTWYYGVMDNGSANCGMMEVGRLLAQRRSSLRRGLRICFWSGHSHGRYSGSAWYADTHWDELDRRCVAHVNVDSLGGAGAAVLENAAAMTELRHLAAEAVQAHTNQTYKGKRKARNSDESFVGIGIPSMLGSISEQPHRHSAARNALGWWWHTPHDLLDKIDEANLVRDTRVLMQVCWRLLTDAVVPLDHAATADALAKELEPLAGRLDGRFPIAPLMQATAALRQAAEAASAPGGGAQDVAAANVALMRASRALVPADYTLGDRFRHDPALQTPAWAAVQPLRDLAATEPGSDDEKFVMVDALRARNRLAHALREATAALHTARTAMGH